MKRTIFLWVLLAAMLSAATSSMAQVPEIPGRPTPSPTATPRPTQPPKTPPPTATPTEDPIVDPFPTSTPSASPDGSPSPSPSLSPPPLDGGDGLFGPVPDGFSVPRLPRTAARNTIKLVRILEELTTVGFSLEEAMSFGMGRVPVGGLAYWSDDWWNPRFTPYFHLHEGLDMFADFGTPVRAPDDGVVTRTVDGAVGGLAVWMRGTDGTSYYFAHLQEIAEGIDSGQKVRTGTVLGTVGDSGNARGGAPHLHFEIQPPGSDSVPPKPYVDAWLDEAEANAQALVDARIADVIAERRLLRTEQSLQGLLRVERLEQGAAPEYPILLALLDPVGSAVGILPGLTLEPSRRLPVPESFLQTLVHERVGGSIPAPAGD